MFNWALYENLRQIERRKAFRLLRWAVDSLPPPWIASGRVLGVSPMTLGLDCGDNLAGD